MKKLRRRLAAWRAKRRKQVKRRNRFRKAYRTLARRVKRSNAAIKRLRNRIIGRPRIIKSGLSTSALWGYHSTVSYVTGHHTAGPTDTSLSHALSLCRSYHDAHAGKGWGGIGYHFCLARTGEIVLLRPAGQIGTHVGGANTGNVGVMCHGTTGDKPTEAQARALRWLLENAHTKRMPASHRIDLRGTRLRGHNDWPGHESNACPGTHKTMYLSGGAKR